MFECNDGHSFYVIGNRRWNIDKTAIEKVVYVYQEIYLSQTGRFRPV